MNQKSIIKSVNLLIPSNKGISLEEQYKLKKLTPLRVKGLNETELVSVAKNTITDKLGRTNISPRDLKKAIINYIEL